MNNNDIYLDKIKEYIGKCSGMLFENFRGSIFHHRLDERIKQFKFDSYKQYFEYVSGVNKKEINEIISLLTVNETFFFRDKSQFDYVINNIFKEFSEEFNGSKIKILSIGCSSGDEPYSIAMCAAEFFGVDFLEKVEITACDIDKDVLELAKTKSYSQNTHRLNNLPAGFKEKYLVKENHKYNVSKIIKNAVNFKFLNAVQEDLGNGYDIIFCKNMMIYLSESAREKLLKKIYYSLKLYGYFFIGASEIISMPENFKKILFQGGTVYKKISEKTIALKNNIPSFKLDNVKKNIQAEIKDSDFSKNILINSMKYNAETEKEDNDSNIIIKKICGSIESSWVNEDFFVFIAALDELLESKPEKKYILDFSKLEFIDHESCIKLIKVIKILERRNFAPYLIIDNTGLRSKFKRAADDYYLHIFTDINSALLFLNKERKAQ